MATLLFNKQKTGGQTVVRTIHVWVFDTNRKQATNRVSVDQNRREWWSNHTPTRYRNSYAKPPKNMKTCRTACRSDN